MHVLTVVSANYKELREPPLLEQIIFSSTLKNMSLAIREVKIHELQSLAGQPNIQRVGATGNPDTRISQYRRDGYTGTFLYAPTQNMKKAEDKLLECTKTGTCPCNVQGKSNVPEGPGYVYVIQQ